MSTTVLLTVEETLDALRRAPRIAYRPPGAATCTCQPAGRGPSVEAEHRTMGCERQGNGPAGGVSPAEGGRRLGLQVAKHLAFNMAFRRDTAGAHFRRDEIDGIVLADFA